jgi:hypothetical protein
VRVLASSRTRLSKLSCHCTGTASVAFPQTNVTATRARTMGQSYPLIHPGPGANPPIYPPFLVTARRGLPEGSLRQNPQNPLIFFFCVCAHEMDVCVCVCVFVCVCVCESAYIEIEIEREHTCSDSSGAGICNK